VKINGIASVNNWKGPEPVSW